MSGALMLDDLGQTAASVLMAVLPLAALHGFNTESGLRVD